jgi:hypothetical protein
LERQLDDLTRQSRYALDQERRLREQVAIEAEARQLQRQADRSLEQGMRRPRKARAQAA